MSGSKAAHPPEFMQYLKQRDAALDSVKTIETELRDTQSKLYDAMKRIDDLTKKLKEADSKTTKTSNKKMTPVTTATTKRTSISKSNSTGKSSGTAANESGTTRRVSVVSSFKQEESGLYHPYMADIEPFSNSREYYWKIAEKYPTLPMLQILEAEKKFLQADTEGNGALDKDAVDKVLSDSVGMFTSKQLDEIFKEIDTDNSGTIDFQKALSTMNRLFTRRKTNLPQLIQQNYTKICSIQ